MDFDISTLLYILGALGYFLFTRGKKKPKTRPQRPAQDTVQPAEEENRPSFEDLLAEFTGAKKIEQETEYKAKPKTVPVAKSAPTKRVEEAKQPSYVRAERGNIDTKLERFQEFDDVEEGESFLDDLRNPDTARKAFIYSEIFQRRY